MDEILKQAIIAAGQEHLLRFIDNLSAGELAQFTEELAAIDWAQIPALSAEYVLKRPDIAIPADLAPAEFFPLKPADAAMQKLYCDADA